MNVFRGGRVPHWLRCDSGAALVEFALVMPLLFTIVFGIVDFGRAWHTQQVLVDASREGARRAAVYHENTPPTEAEIRQVVIDYLDNAGVKYSDVTATPVAATCDGYVPSDPAISGVEITGCGWTDQSNTPLQMRVRYEFDFIVLGPFLGWATEKNTVTLLATSDFRNE